jgi:serine/threonine protein kinase
LKIIDFGFSTKSFVKLNTYCGTPPYMAPEIVTKIIYDGSLSDIWSLGIILHLMIYGVFPFKASSEKELYRLIEQGKLHLSADVSPEINILIEKMIKKNAKERWSLERILAESWFK